MINRFMSISLILSLLWGCAAQSPKQNRVLLAPGKVVTLPSPSALGKTLSASQLILADWNGQQHQLPVQLEVDTHQIALAGFSAWGGRILSLHYQEGLMETEILPGLDNQLPQPEQVLFNLMLTLWPIEAWTESLEPHGWQLIEQDGTRRLLDDKGELIAKISYQASPFLNSDIHFEHFKFGYKITIKTLQHNYLQVD